MPGDAHTVSRRTFLQRSGRAACSGTLAGAFATVLAHAAPSEKRPNVVFIYADDLGYGDLGCYGATAIHTPNIDGMARDGLRFTSFYANASVCTPSRAGLLTGRYPIRSGLTHVLWPTSESGIDASEITVATALKGQGYKTACVGKWHLGHLPPHLPTNNGFDYYFGVPYSNDMDRKILSHPPLPLMRNETTIEDGVDQRTLTRRYTEEAVEFIRGSKEQPFFLYLAHSMPHVPLAVSPEFDGKSKGGLYGDVIEELDWSVGRILAELKNLGLDGDTLVVFTSDNGPWLWQGDRGGDAGDLRGGKGTTFEGGIRVPCVVRWPGVIEAGRVIPAPAIMLDWFPTLVGLAGGVLPSDRPIDGRDISGMLLGTGPRADSEFFFFRGRRLQSYRSGPWKLKRPFSGFVYTARLKHPRLLFNLEDDPEETRNLAHEYPERVRRMHERMMEFEASLGAPPRSKR